MWNKI